ncbi:MAG TPA: NUDIX domain-containing protein [Caulobacteraceae bacterium]|jgi:nudix-type nucleoside diphosphatase (YffH/AdpP family)|nr:NUDIX domain-containing protein [Caulobacteraceae bacterium]
MGPKILRRETVYAGYVTVEKILLRMPTGEEVWREVESHGHAVAVLPYDAARALAYTVRLHRVPVMVCGGDDPLEEACAGMIDPTDAGPADAARREALEELGVRLGELEGVGRVWTSPGVVAERCDLFLAPISSGDRVGQGGGAAGEHEDIEVLERSLRELASEADAGMILDAKLLMLVQALRLRLPGLF